MVLPRFIDAARKNKPLRVFGDGQQTRCFCYVKDAVEALIRLRGCGPAFGQVYNIGSADEISILTLAQKVIAQLGSRSSIELVPYQEAYAPGFEDMLRRKPDLSKLRQTVGFEPKTTLSMIIDEIVRSGE